MNKIERLPSVWSILPDELNKLKQSYQAYLVEDTDKIRNAKSEIRDYMAVEKNGTLLDRTPEKFFMAGDIAVMQIEGVIFPKVDIFSFLFGGATLDVMTRDFNTLINDDSVRAIILEIDSPGGVVFGVQEFANLVYEGRARKNIFAVTSSMMASAAMWIGAAADEVHITDNAAMTGSIGVVINHIDVSELERKFGIKTTEITAGKYKRIASSVKPLSEEGREDLQRQVDHVYEAFTSDIAKFRGVSIDTVLSDMADGKTFIGSQGIVAGLVDEVINIDSLIEQIELAESPQGGSININVIEEEGMSTGNAAREMSADTLKAKHPGCYEEVFKLGAESVEAKMQDEVNSKKEEAFEKGRKKGQKEGEIVGAQNELDRIKAVEKQSQPGHEELIKGLKFDGKTTGPEAAVAVLKAVNENRAKGLETLEAEAVKPVEGDIEDKTTPVKTKTAKEEWDADPKLQEEFTSFEAFEAFENNSKAGNVKVLSKK